MTRKANAISTLARETMARIVGSPAEWEAFLRSAARMYKYAFPEQVLIYAQRPNATACATLEQWNRCRYRRWVKPGAVGIALLEDTGPQLGLKYVFDLSDTRQTPYSRPFSTWAYRPEYEEAVLESLENHFGEVEGTGLSRRLHAIVGNLVEDNAAEYAAALQGGVAGSYLGDTDPPVLLELLKLAVAPNVEYMILCRLGLPVTSIGEGDMQAVTLFNTLETAAQLGAAVSDIAKMALGRIERTVKSIEKEAGTFAKSERVTENELEEEIKRRVEYGTDIPAGGQLPDSRLDAGTGAGSAGQVRDAAQAVPEGAPEGDIRRVIAKRDAASPSVGGGPGSPGPGGTDDAGADQGRGVARGTESPRPAGMDRPDEQHPPAGRGAGHGADLQLEGTNERPEALKSPGLSLSTLAGVEEQMDNILAAEHPGPFPLSQGEIDHVLRRGSGFQNGKLRIFLYYQQTHPLQARAAFLKKEYGIGGGSHVFANGQKGNIWYDGKGLCISQDSGSAFSNPDWRISWRKAAQRIGELIAQGQYLTEGEQAQLAQYQEAHPIDRPQASQEIMALAQEERSRQPGEYRLSLGDSVFLHGQAHVILAMAGELVELSDPQYPLLTVSYPREQFIRLVGQDKRNDHLLAPEQRNDLAIHTADLLPEQDALALDGPAPGEQPAEKPERQSEPIAIYPAQQNNLPFDVVVERLHIPDGNLDRPPALDYRITDDALGHGGPKAKFRMNLEAIRTLGKIEGENRRATQQEQEILSRYVGWGGIPQAFDPNNSAWASEYAELKAALTETEYESARASTLNAHYTSPIVIKAVYQAIENLGFQRGNILEPSCGVGNFFGLLPEQMAGSKRYGVELDAITGRIARQLYQNADIQIKGFEDADYPDNFFDLAIGNVPFGSYGVSDQRYDKYKFHIHDYFFAKAIDKVRPGGVVAFITSKGTLDKQDEKVRRYLAERAELLGAIRLPNNTFTANAGTEVTTDILFLQKRDRPMVTEPEWLYLGRTEDGIPINRYFLSHPEMLLGRMAWWKNMYGNQEETACLPLEGKDLAAQLADAIPHIQGQIQAWELEEAGEQGEWLPADPSIPNFSFGLLEGNLYYRMDSQMQPAAASVTALARIRAMIGLRECTRRLMQYQLENHPEARIRQEQERLNTLYDSFVEQYGRITSRGNKSAFRDDASYPLLCSLEVLDEEGKFQRKAAMFTRRTIRAQPPVSHVDTPEEALALSIGERARVDIAYMAALTGLEEAALIQQLQGHIYRDLGSLDSSDMDWAAFAIRSLPFLTADAYLSGDVRHKLRQANALLEGLTRHSPQPEPETLQTLQAQILALQAVQPKDLEAGDIEVRLGSTWIPPEVVETFMYGLLNTPPYRRNKIKVLFSPYTAIWSVTGKSADFDNNNAILKYGTHRVNAYKLLEESLNLRDVRVLDTVTIDGKETRLLNQKETIIAQQKQQAIKDAFQAWIWKDPERRERLVKRYNEKFNAIRPREYDGSHIQFHGMNPEIQLRPHQKNAVARILYGGNTLLGHVVGSGKTFTMAAAAMELRRLGLCHKPMFVVPNHLTDQWAGEFLQLYPAANILVTTKRDFERQNRQRIFSRIATGEYDAVIIGHSQFEKLPVSQERQQAHLAEQIDQVIRGISEAKAKNAEPFTIKQMERTKKQLQTKLERLNHTERKDRVITFEELGVDRLFVDEAHSFKNLAAFSKMRNVAGISQAEAQKSSDMFMKCRYLDDLTGNRGVIFATGTPISNTMVEMYTMQRYLQYDALVQRGLAHFDAWASTFGETITAMELAPEGTGFRLRTRFARFFNLPELTSMFREVADIQTADMLKLPVPKVEYHTEVLEPSKFQRDMLLSLADRAEAVRAGSVKPTEDTMLRITGDGRKLALDQRMLNSLLPDDPMSKVNACVDHVLRIWRDTAAEKLTQLLFCDLSTPRGEGFHVYQDIKEKLVRGGIPEQEIAFIHDADSEAQKATLFSKVRSGAVRVLLGSTAKMGAGTNVQRLLVAEHHLDCPWRPADIEQREGRIIRQGNQNATVHIYRYVTKDTFDAYMWATLEAKQRFISQVMTSRSPARSCEDMDEQTLSYAEVKSLATGDPRIKERMDLEMEISKLKLLRASHMNQRFEMQSRLQRIPLEIQSYEQAREKLAADHTSYMQNKAGDFSMTIFGTRYAERKDAGAALLSACQAKSDPAPEEIGAYRGFRLLLAYANMQFTAILKGEGSYSVELGDTAIGNIQRLEHQLERLAPSVKAADCKIDALKQEQQTLEADAEQPFPQEAELTEKSQRLIALDAALKLKTHADRVQDTEIDQEETPSQAREEYVR